MQMSRIGYEVIAEDSANLDTWLASIRGIGLNDVVAKDISVPDLPGFIPTVRRGSGKLFTQFQPPYVGVLLRDVVSPIKLEVAANLNERTGAPLGTKFILMGYGSDQLIENLWPKQSEVFEQLAQLGFAAVTGINYSIWDDQPHAERLINIKRGLLTFEAWQQLGVPAIPHIYWCGRKDLDAWLDWLTLNPSITTIAINLQTLESKESWATAMVDLAYFAERLSNSTHVLVTGPQKLERIQQVTQLFPNMTLSNGFVMRMAASGQLIESDGHTVSANYSEADRSSISSTNFDIYDQYMRQAVRQRSPRASRLVSVS